MIGMQYLKERQDVLSTAKQMVNHNLVSGTWGNVSVRVKGEAAMVITPSGLAYKALGLKDMVVVGWDGVIVEGDHKPSIETQMHMQIYNRFSHINAIVHVHSPYATAFAVAGKRIPMVIEEAAQVIGHDIKVASYAPCGTWELARNAVSTLTDGDRAVLLSNHGLVALGETAEDALKVCDVAERTAMIAIFSAVLGRTNCLTLDQVNIIKRDYQHYGPEKEG